MGKTKTVKEMVSPYNLAKIASEQLGKKVVPQQVYAAVRSGSIPTEINDVNHYEVELEYGLAWVEGLKAKQAERKARVKAATRAAKSTKAKSARKAA